MGFIKKNNDHGVIGTHNVGNIELIPAKLIRELGNPMGSDNYKVSGEYVFESEETGEVFTIYDWKWTTLYDEDNPYTPEAFWNLEKPIMFNLGSKKSSEEFYKFKFWLKRKASVGG